MTRFSRSIAGWLAGIALVAADCWCIRALFDDSAPEIVLAVWHGLPMANICAVAASGFAVSPHRPRAFLAGFVVSGLLAIVAFAAGWILFPTWIADPVSIIDEHFYHVYLDRGDPQRRDYPYHLETYSSCARFAVYLALSWVIPTSLQLNVALAGGWIWDRASRRRSVLAAGASEGAKARH